MKTQQQADREEQQRIKNLVLSYDPGDTEQPAEGEDELSIITQNSIPARGKGKPRNPDRNKNAKQSTQILEKRPSRDHKMDKSNRPGFRSRKLQLSDVDWRVWPLLLMGGGFFADFE